MNRVTRVEDAVLEPVLDAVYPSMSSELTRQAFGQFHAARMKTRWGRRCLRAFALMEDRAVLAYAEQSDLGGTLDGSPVRVAGVGAIWADPARRGAGHGRMLVETLVAEAAREGAEVALVLSRSAVDEELLDGFQPLAFDDVTLEVAQSPRHGAPMTMVRGGEDRDLAAIAAMGRARVDGLRFSLDRDADFIQHAVVTRRLLAGLGQAHARQLHFFIAEEGVTAAAYVIVTVAGETWTLEECGDRDPTGARVGALLQALIAREPGRRPTIRARLPTGFVPPQVTISTTTPSPQAMGIRLLGARASAPVPAAPEVMFWRTDLAY